MTITIWKYLLHQLLISFLASLLCFVLILEFADLFTNINRFIANDVDVSDILWTIILYMPKSIAYGISPALLFASTYTLAGFYSSNELISILNAGISYRRFILPIILLGSAMSLFSFAFNEIIVIDTFNKKNEFTSDLLGFSNSLDNTQVVIKTAADTGYDADQLIYYAKYYQDKNKQMQGSTVIFIKNKNSISKRIDAERAVYSDNGVWEFYSAFVYTFSNEGVVIPEYFEIYTNPLLNLDPVNFQNTQDDIASLKLSDARRLLERIKLIDSMTYRSYLTDYFERFSFSLTPLIVIMFSSAFAWLFKKNILFFSILLSLMISVLYYITEMLSILFAKQGYIPPLLGAWLPFIIFGIIGALLLKAVKT